MAHSGQLLRCSYSGSSRPRSECVGGGPEHRREESHALRVRAARAAEPKWGPRKPQGWNEVFLDLHPERGLKARQRWQEALKLAAERCEVVLFLISPAWVASKWCLTELLLAKQLGKTIIGEVVEPTPIADIPAEMTAEWQLVDLTTGTRDHEITVILPRGAGTATGAFVSEG